MLFAILNVPYSASISGESRKAGFGEGTPQQVSREGQNRRIADFGTVVETCSVTAADCPCLVFPYIERTGQGFWPAVGGLFSFPPILLHRGALLPAERGFSQNFFCFCNAGNRILATGGAENFSFHSPHHRVLKFAKQNSLFFLCFLLRTKIKNAKCRSRKIFPSLTTTI